MKKKIAFFGDSFCAYKHWHEYDTYINNLDKAGYEIVRLGYRGSSIWDLWLNQYNRFINESPPDIMIFVWTNHSRLYHKKYRNINPYNLKDRSSSIDKSIRDAVENYYLHLYDEEKAMFEYKSVLHYFDNVVLSKIINKCQILHLWSFGIPNGKFSDKDTKEITYAHRWTNGMELRPPLIYFGMDNFDWQTYQKYSEDCPNHIYGQERNKKISDFILLSLGQYESGKLITYDL